MCTVSMVGEFYGDVWRKRYPYWEWTPVPIEPTAAPIPIDPTVITITTEPTKNKDTISAEEFAELRKEVLQMKELLKRALKYDEENGEPDCQMDEKVETLKKVAELVGVDLADVLK